MRRYDTRAGKGKLWKRSEDSASTQNHQYMEWIREKKLPAEYELI